MGKLAEHFHKSILAPFVVLCNDGLTIAESEADHLTFESVTDSWGARLDELKH